MLTTHRVRILFSAQEQHVFEEVSETRNVVGVTHVANTNRHGRSGPLCGWIADQQHPHSIGQFQAPIQAVIALGLCDVLESGRRKGNEKVSGKIGEM